MPNAEAVIAKHNAPSASAEAAVDPSSAPPAEGSTAASAPADVPDASRGAEASSPGAAIDHDELQRKLDHDRASRHAKKLRREAKTDREAADKARKEGEAELAKWKALGKDKSWLDAIKAAGRDPREVYAEMQQEALRAGTPEAQIAELKRQHAEELAAVRKEIESDREAAKREKAEAEKAKAEAAKARGQAAFIEHFNRAAQEPQFAPLLDEYEPPALFDIADGLRRAPAKLFAAAKEHKVALTGSDGTFTMIDIFNVMRATQAAHQSRMQRRNQSAAPHASEEPVTQAPQAKPTVNGTAERKAGTPTTIGNELATSRASAKSEKELKASMTREQWRDYVAKKHEHAK